MLIWKTGMFASGNRHQHRPGTVIETPVGSLRHIADNLLHLMGDFGRALRMILNLIVFFGKAV